MNLPDAEQLGIFGKYFVFVPSTQDGELTLKEIKKQH